MRKLFDDILMFCRRWEVDKWVHIVAAIIVAWVCSTITKSVCVLCGVVPNRVVMGLVGVACGAVAVILKDLYDKKTTNLFDEEDVAAGFVGLALYFIVYSV